LRLATNLYPVAVERPKTAWIDNVNSSTGLKLEDTCTIRKVDNRSAWRTTIHSAAYTSDRGRLKARQGKPKLGTDRLDL